MFEHSTLGALLVALVAVHLAVVWLARRRAVRVERRPERLEDGRLRCPDCGAVNDPDYRFCRQCVEKLRNRAPAAPVRPAGGRSPLR